MQPKLIGPLLFQGHYGTLRETFESKVKSASGHVNALTEDQVLNDDPNKLAQEIVNSLLAERVVLSTDSPELIGEPEEKLSSQLRTTLHHLKFLLKASSSEYYFRQPPGIDGPQIAIPAIWSAEGFVLEIITSKLEPSPIDQLLSATRRELEIMIGEVNFLVDHYNEELRRTVPNLILARRTKIQETREFKNSLPYPKYVPQMKPPKIQAFPLRLKVFLSYSHEDERYLNELQAHLSQLKREQFIETWHDRAIPAGGSIDSAVIKEIEAADIILLLVSSAFMSSNYIWNHEVPRALKRHEEGKAVVIPIILRPCDFESAPFAKVKSLPRDRKPVVSWPNRDEAYKDIAVEIRRLVTAKAVRNP